MKPLRVLLVEDEILIALLLTEQLKEMGHEVCATVSTEANAVNAALEYKPDLMLVDVRLEQGSGVSAVEKIVRNGPIPHVFLSGDPHALLARRPHAVVLPKPYRESQLVRAIEIALERSEVVPEQA